MVAFCHRKFRWVYGILLLLPSLSLFAQQQKKYSLSDFVDSAQRHLPVLMQKKVLVDAARAGVTDAKHAFLPTSYIGDEVTAGTDNSIPGSYIGFGVIPSSSSGVRSSNIYQSAIGNIGFFYNQYELLDFGLKKSTVRNAQAYVNLSQADLERERYLVTWQVSKLYLDILKNQFQLAIDRENVSRYETVYKVIQAVTQSGIKPGADSALAMAELSKTRITYNQTYGTIRELQQQLSFLTGIAPNDIDIDTTRTKSYMSALGVPGVPMDTLASRNPLIDYFNKEKLLYLQREDLVKKSYLPKVFLTGVGWARGSSIDYTDNYKSTISGLGYQRFNYLAGLTLEYDLFNIVHRKDKERIARNNTLASEYGLQQQQLSLANVGNKADESIRTATKNLVEIPVQINAAQSAYDQKTAQYKAGIINLVDLTNASFVLYRSQSDYVQTLSDWLLANLDKYSAEGNIAQFIQSIK
ncbi:MAG TPA: TolC family protein [Puia sp.]|jgi:outer membrane protein TolC|nr:TolC family protein [Puia sp.]